MPGNEREGRGAIERARSIYEAVTSGGARAAGARARSVARVLGRTDSSETCMNMEGCRIPARELLHGARSFGGHHRPRRRARRRAYVQVRVVHRDGRRQEVVPVRRRVVRSFRERESDGRGGHGDRRSLRSQPGRAPLDLLDDGLRRRRLDHGSQRIRAPESTAKGYGRFADPDLFLYLPVFKTCANSNQMISVEDKTTSITVCPHGLKN